MCIHANWPTASKPGSEAIIVSTHSQSWDRGRQQTFGPKADGDNGLLSHDVVERGSICQQSGESDRHGGVDAVPVQTPAHLFPEGMPTRRAPARTGLDGRFLLGVGLELCFDEDDDPAWAQDAGDLEQELRVIAHLGALSVIGGQEWAARTHPHMHGAGVDYVEELVGIGDALGIEELETGRWGQMRSARGMHGCGPDRSTHSHEVFSGDGDALGSHGS